MLSNLPGCSDREYSGDGDGSTTQLLLHGEELQRFTPQQRLQFLVRFQPLQQRLFRQFVPASSQGSRLRISCGSENSDDLIRQLVSDLDSLSIEEQKKAAMNIRLLAKNMPENRLKIARAGAIRPLISLISSSDPQLQENGVTAILNLSLCDENKELIASAGAIKPLVQALRIGTSTAKENAACALLRLSQMEENKISIGQSGAIPLLVNLLETGNIRGKKVASTALYTLCSVKENKIRAVESGIMKPLVELMADFGSNMVDKSAIVASVLVTVPEARAALVDEGGIPVLAEIIEVGSQRQKEIAVGTLLQICEDSVAYCAMVAREGAIPPLVALSKSGTSRAKQKSARLLEVMRRPYGVKGSLSHQPTGLPDGGQIVQLDSVEQSANNVFVAPEKEIVKKTLKRKYQTVSVTSLEDLQQPFGCRCEAAVKRLRVSMEKRICREHRTHRLSTMKRFCRQHRFHRQPFREKLATMKGCSLGEEISVEVISLSTDEKLNSRLQCIYIPQHARSSPPPVSPYGEDILQLDSSEQQPLVEFDAENIKACGVKEDRTGRTVSHSENKIERETLKSELLNKTSYSLEDLQQHLGCTSEDVPKNLDDIYDLGVHVPSSFAWKSLEALETLSLQELPSEFIQLMSLKRLTLEHYVRLKKLPVPPQTLQFNAAEERMTISTGYTAQQSACSSHWPTGLPDVEQNVQLHSLEQSTNNVSHSARADQSCPTISLPDWKILRETLKRKCRTISVTSLEDYQRFGGRCEDAVKSLGGKRVWREHGMDRISIMKCICTEHGMHRLSTVKRIYRQHVFHIWPFQQEHGMHRLSTVKRIYRQHVFHSWPFRQEHGMHRLSTVKHIYRQHVFHIWPFRQAHGMHRLSTVKRIYRQHVFHRWPFRQLWLTTKGCSRHRFLYIHQLARSSACPIALSDEREVERPIALSLSDFAATNNRAQVGKDDQSGSTAFHSRRKNTRETSKREWTFSSSISLEDLRPHFGSKRKDAANSLGVSESTLKRICREQGIRRWPYGLKHKVWKPPDQQGGKNTSPTSNRLSVDRQSEMGNGILGDLEEFLPDIIEDPNWPSTIGLPELIETLAVDFSFPSSNPAVDLSIPSTSREGGEAGFSTSIACPNSTSLVVAQPEVVSVQMLNANVGSTEHCRNSAAEALFVGQVSECISLTVPTCSDPAPSPPTTTLAHTMPTVLHMMPHLEGNSFAPSQALLEGQVSGSSNRTMPTCSDPAPGPPTTTFAPIVEALLEGQASGSSSRTMPTCSDPALTQPTTTISQTRQDIRSVIFKATYRDSTVKFRLPPTSGIDKIMEEVAMQLKLELDSFDIEYKDEDNEWITIACDKALRDCLEFSSLTGNQVIRLWVLDKVTNAMYLSGSCGSLKRKRPP